MNIQTSEAQVSITARPAVACQRRPGQQDGFTLTEVLIAIVIVSILAGIAIPSYTNSITKSKRRAAQTCLASFATQMERFYATNLRYCAALDSSGACTSAALTLPSLECASTANTGRDYDYSLSAVGLSTFTLQAAPKSPQSTRDARCGTLTLSNTGAKGVSGADGRDSCW